MRLNNFVLQRGKTDCGIGALATLLGRSYEDVAQAWREALGKDPGCSHYRDLLTVAAHMGFSAAKVKATSFGIRRVRFSPGSSHSHWIVVDGGHVWCPTEGLFVASSYPMKYYGHGIEVIQ